MTGPASGPARRAVGFDWMAEAALASTTVVATAGMERLFSDTSFMRDVLAMGLASHLVAAAARRARLSILAAAVVSAGCLAVTVTVLRYRATAWLMLPTSDTVLAVRQHLLDGWEAANSSSAPVMPVPGLVLTAGFAMWAAAFLADTAAFRPRGSVSALSPAAGLLVFTASVGVADGWVRHAALFCASAAAALVALRLRDRCADAWIEARPGRGARAMGRAGAAAAATAVAAGALAGPMLHGAGASPWVDIEALAATDGTRVVVSPLVQVRSRLVQGQDAELFTVTVPEESPQYWRLMSLDEFDGASWRARSQFKDAVGPLAATLDPSAAGGSLVQTVSLTGLASDYLPAAHELRRVLDDGGAAMQYEASSGALIKARHWSQQAPARLVYTVESVLPDISDPDMLIAADADMLEPAFLAVNTDLPEEVRALVGAEAERVTASADSDYRRAIDLQDYFWADGRFAYDLDIARSTGVEDLADFLFETRAGYCEQFASAYAAMARSVGLPARVAVGFTWGEWDAARGVYAVRGEHAHAWPEVYFAGTGWVRFEPTPGRGAPDDFAVTGRVPYQAGSASEADATGTLPQDVPAPGSEPGPDDGSGLASGGSDRDRAGRFPLEPASGEATASGLPGPLLVGVAVLGALALACGLMPGLRSVARRRRRGRLDGDPAGLVEDYWSEAVRALALIGLRPLPSETPLDLARRARTASPQAGPVDELAVLATVGRYARETTRQAAARASVLAPRVVAACRGQAGLRRRLAAALNPATVFG